MRRSMSLTLRRVRQSFTFDNWPHVLTTLGASITPWHADTLTFRPRSGGRVSCPNFPGARVPIYEVFVEDAYRISELAKGLPSAPVVLDIGAQVGCFSLAWMRALPASHVVAYEASPSTAQWLSRNVEDNGLTEQVSVRAVALAGAAGPIQFRDNVHASALNGQLASSGDLVEVTAITFADAVYAAGGHVDVVKIDTEGAEYDIVLDSRPEDWNGVQRVVMEYHDVPGRDRWDLVFHLAASGLVVTRHEESGPRQGTLWLDRGPDRAGAHRVMATSTTSPTTA